MKEKQITDFFHEASQVVISVESVETTFSKGDDKYEKILSALCHMCAGSFEMPAFGVSIDELTREDKKSGVWIELIFEKTMSHNEMPFEALLIKVEKDYQAFNLIRKTNGKYQGRCFHLSLEKTMEELSRAVGETALNR